MSADIEKAREITEHIKHDIFRLPTSSDDWEEYMLVASGELMLICERAIASALAEVREEERNKWLPFYALGTDFQISND